MHAALLSRPQEVTMLTRRIAVSACALALVLPAAAGAQPIHDQSSPAKGTVAYGDTKYDLQNQQDQNTAKPSYVDRIGSLTAAQMAAAYGTTNPPAAAKTPAVSADDSNDGWQIAALAEAAFLAALALGAAALVARRQHRAPHMGV
jgi:hypothetical protein